MDSRKSGPPPPAPPQVISEHYEPKYKLSIVGNVYTFEIHLPPGFKKEQTKLQLMSRQGKMRIQLDPKLNNKWITLKTEFSVPKKTERGDISAKFENGILRITVQKQGKSPVPATPQPPKLAAEEQKTREEPSKKAKEQAKGENNTSQSANGQKIMEEPSKKSEEQTKCSTPTSQINGKAVSEEMPEKEGTKSTKIKASELKDDKSATERSVEAKSCCAVENGMTSKSTSSKKEESDTRNATKTEHPCTDLARKLSDHRKVLKVALVVLVVVGIGLHVNEMIKSSGEAKE